MDSGVITKSNTDSEILSFDVLDELLERVANAEQSAFTLALGQLRHAAHEGADRAEIASTAPFSGSGSLAIRRDAMVAWKQLVSCM